MKKWEGEHIRPNIVQETQKQQQITIVYQRWYEWKNKGWGIKDPN